MTIFYRCPDPNILSPFTYNPLRGTAEATLYSMFKFPESKRAHFQCDIVICRGTIIIILATLVTHHFSS